MILKTAKEPASYRSEQGLNHLEACRPSMNTGNIEEKLCDTWCRIFGAQPLISLSASLNHNHSSEGGPPLNHRKTLKDIATGTQV